MFSKSTFSFDSAVDSEINLKPNAFKPCYVPYFVSKISIITTTYFIWKLLYLSFITIFWWHIWGLFYLVDWSLIFPEVDIFYGTWFHWGLVLFCWNDNILVCSLFQHRGDGSFTRQPNDSKNFYGFISHFPIGQIWNNDPPFLGQ